MSDDKEKKGVVVSIIVDDKKAMADALQGVVDHGVDYAELCKDALVKLWGAKRELIDEHFVYGCVGHVADAVFNQKQPLPPAEYLDNLLPMMSNKGLAGCGLSRWTYEKSAGLNKLRRQLEKWGFVSFIPQDGLFFGVVISAKQMEAYKKIQGKFIISCVVIFVEGNEPAIFCMVKDESIDKEIDGLHLLYLGRDFTDAIDSINQTQAREAECLN